MQLNNPPRGTSFYESFSDLIFGTLIIFLVVVLALMMRIRGMDAEYEMAVESEIALNKYAGGTSETSWSMSFVIIDGEPKIAFIPRDIWQQWDYLRSPQRNVIRDLCTLYASADSPITVLSIDDFLSMDESISFEFYKGGTVVHEIGDVLTRLYALGAPDQFEAGDAEALYNAIGQMHAGKYGPNDTIGPPQVRKAVEQYFMFLAGPGPALEDGDPDQFFRQYRELAKRMMPGLSPTKDEPAHLVFATGQDRELRIGDATFTKAQFIALLSSISIGKGFYLEFDGPGEEPENPPDWVINEVLVETGIDQRIPSERALELIRQQRQGG